MKERPILFNAEMVQAILSGRKTQTRRIALETNGICPMGRVGDQLWVRETFAILGNEDGCAIDWQENLVKNGGPDAARIYRASCQQKPGNYGLWSVPDDAFWKPHTDNMQYEGSWVPSIHMPRWASRITLEITGVRLERLNWITNADAKAEGYPAEREIYGGSTDAWLWFRDLWEGLYPENTFKVNPCVWVIEFKLITPTGKQS